MKDLVQNRAKMPPAKKLALALRVMRENGPLWTIFMGAYYLSVHASPALAERAFASADAQRKRRALPGLNSAATNKFIWDNWDWSDRGEEWTISSDWKRSVIKMILEPHIHEGGLILEIGPGVGRWSVELQKRADKLIGIDISETCISECRRRFASYPNMEFRLGSGSDLDGVADASVDAIWSFDVFVHINRFEFASYASEFARVLKKGGVGVIHHGSCGGSMGGWRSDVSTADVSDILNSNGLEILEQTASWNEGGRDFPAGLYGDVITIFRHPWEAIGSGDQGG